MILYAGECPLEDEDFPLNYKLFLSRDIIKKDLCVKWDQVCGSENAKLLLQESVILPLEQPHLFTEIKPWKAVLLHGVSGIFLNQIDRLKLSIIYIFQELVKHS